MKHSGGQQLKGCFITSWGHPSQRGPLKRRDTKTWLLHVHPCLEGSPPGAREAGGQQWYRDQFCCTGSNQFWQVYNPRLCIVNIHLQADIFRSALFSTEILLISLSFCKDKRNPPPHRLAGTFAEGFLRLAELLTNWFIRRVLSCNSEVWEELFAFFTQVIKSVHWWSEMNRIVLLPSAQLIVYSVSQRNGRGRLPLQGLITLQRTWIKTKPG